MKRRTFLAAGSALAVMHRGVAASKTAVDFRYAPRQYQTAYCFPDDPFKSLAGERSDLRYGYDRRRKVNYFPFVVQFGLAGMDAESAVTQELEEPAIPIVHTRLTCSDAFVDLAVFATNREGEGRVDNVVLEVRSRRGSIHAAPVVSIKTRRTGAVRSTENASVVSFDSGAPFLVADRRLRQQDTGDGYRYTAPDAEVSPTRPLRCVFRFPQQSQTPESLDSGLRDPDALLSSARTWWRNWKPFPGEPQFTLPAPWNDFLQACTRNILQAREKVDGRLTFQVGPTTYRGLWVVDGNFILEAARYLGYDAEVQQGLETTWEMQRADGGIFAGGGDEHWKDTGIAMFSMIRQAELGQDWSYVRRMQPKLLQAVRFLENMRERGRTEGSTNGRYGLLARGFGDGGIGGGVRDELTNTMWALAGLKALTGAAAREKLSGFEPVRDFYRSLSESFFACARQEMRPHQNGFEFLPMVLKTDPLWTDPDEWKRWRPQSGQWALAQTIYPGVLFSKDDPVVKGYVQLMRACTQEDVPVETGWLPHGGLWNYDAAFCAHACLWAGARDYAMSVFTGFLNHATPLYCWREEQPLHGSLVGGYVGDMPHSWASAECILFLRHMLAMEDGGALRLLAGIGDAELASADPFRIDGSPTRFGRINLSLEPNGTSEWRLIFHRPRGPVPDVVQFPRQLGRYSFVSARGADVKVEGDSVAADPAATPWQAVWRM